MNKASRSAVPGHEVGAAVALAQDSRPTRTYPPAMPRSSPLFLLAASLTAVASSARAQTPYPWSDGVRPVPGRVPAQGYQGPPPADSPQGAQPGGPAPSGWRPMPAQGWTPARSSSSLASSSSPSRGDRFGGVTGVAGLYGGLWDQRGAPDDARVGAFGLGVGLGLRLGVVAAAEVGDVPARALQLKARSRQLLGVGRRVADRTHGKHRVRHLLQNVLRVAAAVAAVCIDGHG